MRRARPGEIMETLGAGIFDNDDARNFASRIVEEPDLDRLEDVVDRVLSRGLGDLEATEGAEALAAADIVARLLGKTRPKSASTEAIDQWVSGAKLEPDVLLINKAHSAVTRVRTAPSELLERMKKSDQFATWRKSLDELSQALKA